MEPLTFAEGVRKTIDVNLETYRKLFNESKIDKRTIPYWVSALNFFHSLDVDQKEVFFSILRQIEVDTVSQMLAILDGVSFLEGQKKPFTLTENEDDTVVNGMLQDLFLEQEYH